MMSRGYISTKLRVSQVACVEVHLKEDGSMLYNHITAKIVKDHFQFENETTSIETIEGLGKCLTSKIPVVLCITGKGVITREVDLGQDQSKLDLLKQLFPNAKGLDFYTSLTKLEAQKGFINVIRKEQADKIIQSFVKENYDVIDVKIGSSSIFSLKRAIKLLPDELSTLNHQFNFSNQKITHIITEPQELIIGDKEINSFSLTALSAGFSFLVEQMGEYAGDIPLISELATGFKYKQKVKVVGMSMLLVFFTVLLMNYFVFDHYNSKYNGLSSELTEYQGFLVSYTNLKEELAEKKELLQETGMSESSKASFYIDRIAASVPKGIQIESLETNPMLRKKTGDKQIKFNIGVITVSGTSKKSTVFNDWLKSITELDWVEKVEKFTYNKTEDKQNGLAEFYIEIKYK
jgi:Tfp pilus assembly protein PilN